MCVKSCEVPSQSSRRQSTPLDLLRNMAKDPAKSIKHEIFSSLEPVYTWAVWLIDVCWSIHVAVESDVAAGSLRAVELRRVLQGDDGVYGSTEDTKRPCPCYPSCRLKGLKSYPILLSYSIKTSLSFSKQNINKTSLSAALLSLNAAWKKSGKSALKSALPGDDAAGAAGRLLEDGGASILASQAISHHSQGSTPKMDGL